jgi:peptidoglycan/xylan/chitin deacetylase (PgdA/CDA1 family)
MGDAVKDAALGVCVALGRRFRLRGLAVLAYHSIDESGSYMSTKPEMFRVQMEWLRDHGYRALSMRQWFAHGATEIERTVVLTFDDGLANFADAAWPVLREMSFSATAYVPTAFVGTEAAWYPEYGLPRLPCMGWDTLRAVRREGADVQSHARSHRDLTRLPPGERAEELRHSKASLEEGLGDSVEHLAYPFGATSPAVRQEAREAGYRSAVGLRTGRWRPSTDPFGIPREGLDLIAIRTRKTARLSIEACARGTFGWYTEAKARVRGLYSTPPHLQIRQRQ